MALDYSAFSKLPVKDLVGYLERNGISSGALRSLEENNVSGLALLLVSEDDLKEMIKTIGDRAIVRNLLKQVRERENNGNEVVLGTGDDISNETDFGIEDSAISNTSSQVSVSDEEQPALSPSSDFVNVSDVRSTSPEVENIDDPPKKKLKISSSEKATVTFTSKKKQEPPLPRPFGVPQNFPHDISTSLERKKLVGKPRTKFITIVAQSIYRFKSYPSDDEYYQVVQELVKKWPFLNNEKGNKNLVVALRMRMAYLRKPDNKKRGNPSTEKTSSKVQQKALKNQLFLMLH